MEKLLQQAGACAGGRVSADRLRPHMTEEQLARAETLCPGWQGLVCAAFAYGPERLTPGRLSLYARGADYHSVLRQRLEPVAAALAEQYPGKRFVFCADASPFPEVSAAALAGLGKLGQNGLIITQTAGSFVFLGFLVTDANLAETGGDIVPCGGCGACKRACPGGALGERLDQERCLSALTQMRGELTPEQTRLVRRGGMLWGCDRCQLDCPENRTRTAPPLPEFSPLPDPTAEELQLSDRAFRRQFAGRAFTWRGVQPLRRNDTIIKESPPCSES